ncbi:ABC transporter permease [Kocuria rhizophila]|uniref:ABC transporter permease n=1 Tax=Kocuria rhizophila TaxID=72000 RepID=UPI001EF46121|nr:ABC transporter permease [Kocuria rhizophila]MCG7424188.1 ABC transporter permease [Kocuria rhizophila]MCT1879275.1 ABC transporter permease [Kocuria rhizophila]MCT2249092.1 ABC transporter permease [Kocuria rhizophila]
MTRRFSATPRWVLLPAAVGALLILLPLVGMLLRIDWAHLGELLTSESSLAALWLSLRTAVVSTALCVVLGCPLALVLARFTARGLTVFRSVVLLPLVLPPVVGGIALLYTFGRMGFLGAPLAALGVDIAFSTAAVVLAQSFVALPFLVVSLEGALRTTGTRYEQIAAGLGASPTRTLFRVTVPVTLPAVLSGAALSFARCLGEFGATLTFAGSLEGVTRTLPLEIYLQRETDPDAAVALSLLLVLVALLVVSLTTPARRRRGAGFRANLTRWVGRDGAGGPGGQYGPEPRAESAAPAEPVKSRVGAGAGGRSEATCHSDRSRAGGVPDATAPRTRAVGRLSPSASLPLKRDDAPSATATASAGGLAQGSHRPIGLCVDVTHEQRGVAAEFTVEPGATVALLGPNGVGKSTVFGVVAGLVAPDRGAVHVGERCVIRAGSGDRPVWVPAHRRGVALMAQEPLLFPHLSVLENVAFGPRVRGAGKAEGRRRARAWLREVDAEEFAGRHPDELSGGQAQRVAIARVLAADPRVILLDEPMSALDVAARPRMREVLKRVLAGRTAVVVTHDEADVAELADRVVRMDRTGGQDPLLP